MRMLFSWFEVTDAVEACSCRAFLKCVFGVFMKLIKSCSKKSKLLLLWAVKSVHLAGQILGDGRHARACDFLIGSSEDLQFVDQARPTAVVVHIRHAHGAQVDAKAAVEHGF